VQLRLRIAEINLRIEVNGRAERLSLGDGGSNGCVVVRDAVAGCAEVPNVNRLPNSRARVASFSAVTSRFSLNQSVSVPRLGVSVVGAVWPLGVTQ
jgi:hypothetical protein